MTRLELQQAVIDNTRRPDKVATINMAINMALSEICRTHRFRQLIVVTDLSVVAGDNLIALPEDFSQLREVRVIGVTNLTIGNELRILPQREVQRLYPTLQVGISGRPDVAYELA